MSERSAVASSSHGRTVVVLGTMLAVGLTSYVLWSDRERFLEVVVRGPRWWALAMAVVFTGCVSPAVAWRWQLLLGGAGVPFCYRDVYRLVVQSNVANMLLPIPITGGGDAAKAALLATMTTAKTQSISTIVVDRVLGLTSLLAVGAVAGIAGWRLIGASLHFLTTICLLLALIIPTVMWAACSEVGRKTCAWTFRIHHRLASISRQIELVMEAYRSQPRLLVSAIAIGMLGQTLTVAAFALCAAAIGIDGNKIATLFVCAPFVFISTALPLPYGALGVAEEVAEQLLRIDGVAGGGIIMIAYRCTQTASTCLLAMFETAAGLFRRNHATQRAIGGLSEEVTHD